LISFPSRSLSNPVGSILCPTDNTSGLMLSVLNPADFASASMFVSKISLVLVIFPMNWISMKSFFCIVMFVDEVLGF